MATTLQSADIFRVLLLPSTQQSAISEDFGGSGEGLNSEMTEDREWRGRVRVGISWTGTQQSGGPPLYNNQIF